MRDKEGIYLGACACEYYVGIDSYQTRTCCGGGKTIKYCLSKCKIHGVVESEVKCSSTGCKERREIFNRNLDLCV